MTRWAEAVPTSRITAKDVARFVFNNICCRFDTPLEIISNRGPGFRGDLVKELMIKLGVKHRHSTPYYPHCNGLVENVNGMICKIISKHVGKKNTALGQALERSTMGISHIIQNITGFYTVSSSAWPRSIAANRGRII